MCKDIKQYKDGKWIELEDPQYRLPDYKGRQRFRLAYLRTLYREPILQVQLDWRGFKYWKTIIDGYFILGIKTMNRSLIDAKELYSQNDMTSALNDVLKRYQKFPFEQEEKACKLRNITNKL